MFANPVDQSQFNENIVASDLSSNQFSDLIQSIDDRQYSNILTHNFNDQFNDGLNNNHLNYSLLVGVMTLPAFGMFAVRSFLNTGLTMRAPWLIGLSASALSALSLYLGIKVFKNQSFSESLMLSMTAEDFDKVSSHKSITSSTNTNFNDKAPDPFPKQAPFLDLENDQLSETDSYKRGSPDALLEDINQDPQVLNKLIIDSVFLPSSLNSSKIAHLNKLVTLVLSLSDDQIRFVIENNIKIHLANDKYKWILDEKVDSNLQSLSYRDLYLSQDYSKWNQQSLRQFLLSQVTTGSSLHFLLKYFFDLDSSTIDRVLANDYRLVGEDGKVLNHLLWSKRIELLKLILSFDPQNYVQRHGPLADDNISIDQLNLLIKTISDSQLRARINTSLWSVFEYKIQPKYLQSITSQSIVQFIETLKTPGKQYFFISSLLRLIESSPYEVVNLIDDSETIEPNQLDLDAVEQQIIVDFFNFFDDSGFQSSFFRYHTASIEDIMKALESHPILVENFEITEELASAFKLYFFTYIKDDPIKLIITLSKILHFSDRNENTFHRLSVDNDFPLSIRTMTRIKSNIIVQFIGFYHRRILQTTNKVTQELSQYQTEISKLSEQYLADLIKINLSKQQYLPKKISLKPDLKNIVNEMVQLGTLYQRVLLWSFLKLDELSLESIALDHNISLTEVREVQKQIYKRLSIDSTNDMLTIDDLIDKYHALSNDQLIDRFFYNLPASHSTFKANLSSLDISETSRLSKYMRDFIKTNYSNNHNKYYIFLSEILGFIKVESFHFIDHLSINLTEFSHIIKTLKLDIARFKKIYSANLELLSRYNSFPHQQLVKTIKDNVSSNYTLGDSINPKEDIPTVVNQILSDTLLVQDVFFSLFLNFNNNHLKSIASNHKVAVEEVKEVIEQVFNMLDDPQAKIILSLNQLKKHFHNLSDSDLVQRFNTENSSRIKNFNSGELNAELIRNIVSSNRIFANDLVLHVFLSLYLNLDNADESDLKNLYSLVDSSIYFTKTKINKAIKFYLENLRIDHLLITEFKTYTPKQIYDLLKAKNSDLLNYNYSKDQLLASVNTILNYDLITKRVFLGQLLQLNKDTAQTIAKSFNTDILDVKDIKLKIYDILYDPSPSITALTFDQLKHKYTNLSDLDLLRRVKNSKYLHYLSSKITPELIREFVSVELSDHQKLLHLFFSFVLRLDNASLDSFSDTYQYENNNPPDSLKEIFNLYKNFYGSVQIKNLVKEVNSLDNNGIITLLNENIKQDKSLPDTIHFKHNSSQIIEQILNLSSLHQYVFIGLMLKLGDISLNEVKLTHDVSHRKINQVKIELFNMLNYPSFRLKNQSLDLLKEKFDLVTDLELTMIIDQSIISEDYKILDPSPDLIRAYVRSFSPNEDLLLHVFLSQMLKLDNISHSQLISEYDLKKNSYHYARKKQKIIDDLVDFSKRYHAINSMSDTTFIENNNKLLQESLLSFDNLKKAYQSLSDNHLLWRFKTSKDFSNNKNIDNVTIELLRKFVDEHIVSTPVLFHMFLSIVLKLDNANYDDLAEYHNLNYRTIQQYYYRIKNTFFNDYIHLTGI